ncbi:MULTISPECIES: hypothetical protein [unclassified Acinetobacter]|uniref:hypothetical protein n=1 Tax=unclassified Acinetobacter TaxID=196816 RepID=UPI001C21B0D0|nr:MULTISPECIES: hypothetical protein [unclassified Acinetobacter]
MKKVLKTLMIAALAIPTLSFAETSETAATTTIDKVQQAVGSTTTQLQRTDTQVTVVSPRTGIRYTFANQNRPIVLQTPAIAAANAANADRIVATNPALSSASQQQAKQALLNQIGQLAQN